MPQSLAAVYVHIVFATKNRRQHLSDPTIHAKLCRGLGKIANREKCQSVSVGGYFDHVHLLLRQHSTVALADLIKTLKVDSNIWLKKQSPDMSEFAWQSGYGAFSIDASRLDIVRRYIETQVEHHYKETFQEEFRRLLREHGMDWDERYVWD